MKKENKVCRQVHLIEGTMYYCAETVGAMIAETKEEAYRQGYKHGAEDFQKKGKTE